MSDYIRVLPEAVVEFGRNLLLGFRLRYAAYRLGFVVPLEQERDEARADLAFLSAQLKRISDDNIKLAGRVRALNLALDARNARAGTDALIAGRTRYGEIVSDTALTYDEVYLPGLGVTLKVREDGFDLPQDEGAEDMTYTTFADVPNGHLGMAFELAFERS